jgi:PAS domain S-box-containing protein
VIPKKIIILAIVSVVFVIIISSLVYYNIVQFLNSNRWAAQTYQVLNHLEIVYSDLRDIETYTRGYINTGNELYFESYRDISKELTNDLTTLRTVITNDNNQDNPPDDPPNKSLNKLEKLIKDKLKLQEEQIKIRRANSFNPANYLVMEEVDKTKMDEIRNIITAMKLDENNILADRLKERASRTFGLFAITSIMIILLIAAIITTITLFRKELKVRRKVHDTLQEGLDYSNMIIDTINMPLLVLDSNLKILSGNRSFYEHFNFKKEEIEEKQFFEIIKGKFDYNDLLNRLRSIIPDDTSFENYELELTDSRIISLDARKIFRILNNVHMILVGLEDITARKHAEEQLKLSLIELEDLHDRAKNHSRELEELNETKDKLFSIIAHDLRSPFQVLASASNLLLEDLDTFNKEEIQQIAGELRTTVNTQHKVVDNLLTWVQMQKGNIVPHLRRLFLFDKVKLVCEQLKTHAENKNIQIINSVPIELVVIGDMDMLQIIFHNLIYNAIKYCNTGGLIEIGAKKAEGEITVSVCDNGIGMEDDIRNKLFTIDSQVKRHGTMDEKGTGLGLNISKEMVEKQGGRIWVESEPGKGSTFYFSLAAGVTEQL